MAYQVKELFYSLQGEGAQSGRAAVFCRFTGCNLWSGLESDRATAVCRFCDTDFVGVDGPQGGRFETPQALAAAVAKLWPKAKQGKNDRSENDCTRPSSSPAGQPWVICTGGEPLLQLDAPLVEAFRVHGFRVALETNGTRPLPCAMDWVCVSPKAEAPLVLLSGDELKWIFPQEGAEPSQYESLAFRHFFLQPMDGPYLAENTRLATQYCLDHPQWRLSLQIQKTLGIP